jgi:rod shape-determining protein MreD
MKIFSFYFLLALLALSIQATLLKGTKPDFIFILVYLYSLRYGQMKGMAYGALTGLLIDSTSGFILGPNIISKTFIGYIVPSVKQKLFQWNVIISTVMIAIFSIFDIFVVYVSLETFADISFINRAWKVSIMQVVYTAMIGIIFYPILIREKTGIERI